MSLGEIVCLSESVWYTTVSLKQVCMSAVKPSANLNVMGFDFFCGVVLIRMKIGLTHTIVGYHIIIAAEQNSLLAVLIC